MPSCRSVKLDVFGAVTTSPLSVLDAAKAEYLDSSLPCLLIDETGEGLATLPIKNALPIEQHNAPVIMILAKSITTVLGISSRMKKSHSHCDNRVSSAQRRSAVVEKLSAVDNPRDLQVFIK